MTECRVRARLAPIRGENVQAGEYPREGGLT